MSYIYPIEPAAMFEDRMVQILGFGIPEADVKALQTGITDMWSDAPGGWVYEWSKAAERYATNGNAYLSAMAYGWAKFPCLANEAKSKAMERELEEYVEAAKTFPVKFERRVLKLPYAGGTADVPVHLLGGPEDRKKAAVLVASGGVDTWKMDSHPLLVALAKGTGFTVMAFDHPGTGETRVPLNKPADEVVLGLVREARAIGDGRVAHFGMSFGGNFAAMTGLSGAVDAAVNLGGPVNDAFREQNLSRLPYGMADILGNAFGFDHQPEFPAIVKSAAELSRTALLNGQKNAPMLVINGADDYFVPQEDTLVFEGRPRTQVHLIPGTGHCAMSKFNEVMPVMIGWLRVGAREAAMTHTQMLLWLCVGAYGAHALEEFVFDWRNWALNVLHLPARWEDFYITNCLVIVVGAVAAIVAPEWPAVALGFPALMLINATFMHVGPFLWTRGRFSPGLITAVLLFYPAGIATMRSVELNAQVLVVAFVVGAALLATPIGFLLLKEKPYFDQGRLNTE